MEKITRVGNSTKVARNDYESKYVAVYCETSGWAYVWLSDIVAAAGWRGKVLMMKFGEEIILPALYGAKVTLEAIGEEEGDKFLWVKEITLDEQILKDMVSEMM